MKKSKLKLEKKLSHGSDSYSTQLLIFQAGKYHLSLYFEKQPDWNIITLPALQE
jgi:hypothetical protein